MKQFSIRKATKPTGGKIRKDESMGVEADEVEDESRAQQRILEEQMSHLSQEEQEGLQPKEVKVVNPLIYDATHKEYLE